MTDLEAATKCSYKYHTRCKARYTVPVNSMNIKRSTLQHSITLLFNSVFYNFNSSTLLSACIYIQIGEIFKKNPLLP